jgi:glycosyltransferase involved in cell wall biosynthesis
MKKDGDIFLVTMSRLVLKNGIADLISSLQHLPKNVKLIILGAGPLETELKCLCLKLGLNYTDEPPVNPGNRVHFLGYIPHASMLPYLAISDVFVRPSLTEGLGNSFLEAMAAGIPVVGTAVGGIPDFLADGETGLVCEVANPHSIAQKVEKYLKDKESRDYVVKNARKLVTERYEWGKVAAEMQALLAKLSA